MVERLNSTPITMLKDLKGGEMMVRNDVFNENLETLKNGLLKQLHLK